MKKTIFCLPSEQPMDVKYVFELQMKTKSVKQCIQFYYLWKKVLPDDHKRLRMMRRKREQLYNLRSRQQAEQQKAEAGATVAVNVTATEAIVEEEPEAMAEAEVSDSESSISGTADDQNTVSYNLSFS